jgi:hypothetical protein
MNNTLVKLAERIAKRWAQLPDVEAVDVRAGIAREFWDTIEIVDYWGPGIEYDDRQTGIHVDLVFYNVAWMDAQIARVVHRHEALLGYTPCFWHTVRISHLLFDHSGWFIGLQRQAMVEYPEALINAIITANHPVLRQIASSYLRQLSKAASRNDLVSLNHRSAALLASYFDILFAINRMPHPGEKRLTDLVEAHCAKRPETMRTDITRLLEASVMPGDAIVGATNQLLDGLDELLNREGLLPSA